MLPSLAAGEREPAADVLVGDVGREQALERPGERRRRRRVSVEQADRERVEHHVDRSWRHRAGPRRPRGGRDRRRAARDRDVAGHGAAERLEVCLAGERRVERLEAARRAQEQAAGVAAALLLQRDLGAQEVGPGPPELAERARLDPCQQRERGLEVARVALRGGGGEQALRTARRRRASAPRRARGRPRRPPIRRAPAPEPAERSSSAATSSSGAAAACARCQARRSGSSSRIGRLRQRAVGLASLARLRRAVDRRAHERMPERHRASSASRPSDSTASAAVSGIPSRSRRAPHERRVAERLRRGQEQQPPRVARQRRQPSPEALLDPGGQRQRRRQAEAAGELRRRQPARKLQ